MPGAALVVAGAQPVERRRDRRARAPAGVAASAAASSGASTTNRIASTAAASSVGSSSRGQVRRPAPRRWPVLRSRRVTSVLASLRTSSSTVSVLTVARPRGPRHRHRRPSRSSAPAARPAPRPGRRRARPRGRAPAAPGTGRRPPASTRSRRPGCGTSPTPPRCRRARRIAICSPDAHLGRVHVIDGHRRHRARRHRHSGQIARTAPGVSPMTHLGQQLRRSAARARPRARSGGPGPLELGEVGGRELVRAVLQQPGEEQVARLEQREVLLVLDVGGRQQPRGLQVEQGRRDDEELGGLAEVPAAPRRRCRRGTRR